MANWRTRLLRKENGVQEDSEDASLERLGFLFPNLASMLRDSEACPSLLRHRTGATGFEEKQEIVLLVTNMLVQKTTLKGCKERRWEVEERIETAEVDKEMKIPVVSYDYFMRVNH